MPSHVDQGFAGKDEEGVRRLRAEVDWLAADAPVGLDRLRLTRLPDQAAELRRQAARRRPRQRKGEDRLAYGLRGMDGELAHLPEVRRKRGPLPLPPHG